MNDAENSIITPHSRELEYFLIKFWSAAKDGEEK